MFEPAPAHERETIVLLKLYEENARVTAAFWEWRHKVMQLCALTLAGVIGLASWMYEREVRFAIAVPFAFGAAVTFLCWRFDHRVAQILGDTYGRGRALEKRLTHDFPWATSERWIYDRFANRPGGAADSDQLADRPPRGSYTAVLRFSYRFLVVFFAAAAIAVVVLDAAGVNWLGAGPSEAEPKP